jgi:hypothetical protein
MFQTFKPRFEGQDWGVDSSNKGSAGEQGLSQALTRARLVRVTPLSAFIRVLPKIQLPFSAL